MKHEPGHPVGAARERITGVRLHLKRQQGAPRMYAGKSSPRHAARQRIPFGAWGECRRAVPDYRRDRIDADGADVSRVVGVTAERAHGSHAPMGLDQNAAENHLSAKTWRSLPQETNAVSRSSGKDGSGQARFPASSFHYAFRLEQWPVAVPRAVAFRHSTWPKHRNRNALCGRAGRRE